MGKASLWFMGAAITTIGIYFAALTIEDKIPSCTPLIIFIFASVFTFLFTLTGIIYMYFLLKIRLNPISYLGIQECVYWTKERQIRVSWAFCDYTKSRYFTLYCVVNFGQQTVNIDERRSLNKSGDPNAQCINGTKYFVEQSKYNIQIDNPDKCRINIKVKPHGLFWAAKWKSIDVDTQIVEH